MSSREKVSLWVPPFRHGRGLETEGMVHLETGLAGSASEAGLRHAEERVRSARAAVDADRLAKRSGSVDGFRGEVAVQRPGRRKAMRAGAGSGRT